MVGENEKYGMNDLGKLISLKAAPGYQKYADGTAGVSVSMMVVGGCERHVLFECQRYERERKF